MPEAHHRELKVGLLVLAALAVLVTGLLVIGDKNAFFVRKTSYFVRFKQVGGLAPGAGVTLDGVNVGNVDRVVLPKNPEQREIDVWLAVDRRFAERLRAPQTPTQEAEQATKARISTLGLLGDKFIELNSGPEKYPAIPDEGEIPAASQPDLDALVASGEDVVGNVAQISHSLQHILARVERGEGLLGELTSQSAAGQQLRQSAISTLQSLQRVSDELENGAGVFPRLVNDRQLADRVVGAVERLDAVLASAQHGEGALPALLNDPGERAKLDETLANLDSVSKDLKELTARFGTSQALLPRLLGDQAYGREVTERLRETVQHLDTATERLVEGKGTAAMLLNDPAIYEAINDVIVGVNKSWMLRWLLQNRQKAGIKQHYQDAIAGRDREQSALATSPTSPSAPVPPTSPTSPTSSNPPTSPISQTSPPSSPELPKPQPPPPSSPEPPKPPPPPPPSSQLLQTPPPPDPQTPMSSLRSRE
jgi:phospholipid/cholesterol/gamma-HCH transport system substrate-binding protein